MQCKCPACSFVLVKRNGHIHNGKQNHRCVSCGRQFVHDSDQKLVDEKTRSLVQKALLERVSFQGICRIFDISMPWLLDFVQKLITDLPQDLNAEVVTENDEIEVAVLEADELWSFVGSKKNPQWLWLVMHSKTRQVLAMEVGPRNKQTAERLFHKLPEPLKKKPVTILTTSLCITTRSLAASTNLLGKSQERHLTLKDLIAPSGSGVQD